MVVNKYKRASEKLMAALRILAVSTAPIGERVLAACNELHALAGQRHAPDPQLATRFAALWANVTSQAPRGKEGALAATIRALSDDELREVAREIHDLAIETERRHWADEFTATKSPRKKAARRPKKATQRPRSPRA